MQIFSALSSAGKRGVAGENVEGQRGEAWRGLGGAWEGMGGAWGGEGRSWFEGGV
jgi:hypothetical protein